MQQAVCVRRKKNEKKKTRNPAARKAHHGIYTNQVTATTSRRRAMKHVPHICPVSLDSIHPGFVEIGLVPLSESVLKTTNVTQTNKIMEPCTHPSMKRLFFANRQKPASDTSLPRLWFITSGYEYEARRPHTCSRPCAFEEEKKTGEKKPKKSCRT